MTTRMYAAVAAGLEVQAGAGWGGQVPGYSPVTLGPGRWLAVPQ